MLAYQWLSLNLVSSIQDLKKLNASKKRGNKFLFPDAFDDKAKELALAVFNGGTPK